MKTIFAAIISLVCTFAFLHGAVAAEFGSRSASEAGPKELISTFDAGNDGWNVNLFNEAAMIPADWDPIAEAIRIDDFADGDIWQFTAPWSGAFQEYCGAILSFDLKDVLHQNASGSGARNGNVQAIQLISRDWSIILDHPIVTAPAQSQYTRYSVQLSPGIGWRKEGSTLPPSPQDFRKALENLGYLRIIGQYVDGDGTCYLDNVSLTPQTTEPQARSR
jgi:hypothetical protein